MTVKRMVVANDVGPISNPDGLRNQIEGGALQGMSRALLEEVTWDDQKVTSVDWRTYHSLPLGFDVPKIEARAAQSARRGSHRRGRDLDHAGGRGHRQCDLRRDRRARPPGPVHAGAREGGAGGAWVRGSAIQSRDASRRSNTSPTPTVVSTRVQETIG